LVCKVELEKVNVYPEDGLDGMGYPVCARKRCSSQGEKALRGVRTESMMSRVRNTYNWNQRRFDIGRTEEIEGEGVICNP